MAKYGKFKADTQRDNCSPQGVLRLIKTITEYWASRGRIAPCLTSEYGKPCRSSRVSYQAIRSDMLNGLPVEKK